MNVLALGQNNKSGGCQEMIALIKEGVTNNGHTLPINLSPKKKKGLLGNTDFVYKNIFHFYTDMVFYNM